jgi:hypothetical protein
VRGGTKRIINEMNNKRKEETKKLKCAKMRETRGKVGVSPNEGVDADGGDVVQSLDSGLDLVLGSTHVADEHKSLQREGVRGRRGERAGTGRGSSH